MKRNYRVLIFDDQKMIRELSWNAFDARGYEVFTFPNPAVCPLSEQHHCPCGKDQACSDIIISDIEMPLKDGMTFVEEQINKGCKCKNIALMSGSFTDDDIEKAKSLGIPIFEKPFPISKIMEWVDNIEKDLNPDKKLTNSFLEQSKE